MFVVIALRTARGLNNREHHMARHRRVKAEREAVAWMLPKTRPALPLVVTLTRCAPSHGLDEGDNLEGALKAVRDQVADWLGVNDRDPRVQWRYAQRRSRPRVWQVWIAFDSVASSLVQPQAGDSFEVLTVSAGSPKPPAWATQEG